MILKTHEKYIFKYFSYNIILVTSIFLVLIFFLNILEEIKFFESTESEIKLAIPLFLTLLNSPSIVFETFPFIFLIATQLLFVSLYDNQEINIFKSYGVKNLSIIKTLFIASLIFGILITSVYYTASSSLKHIYLSFKNKYTSDNKYLAVVNENGLWIKDNINNKINIINAETYNNFRLNKISITSLDNEFNLVQSIISDKAIIKDKNWTLINAQIFNETEISKYYEKYKFKTNFDFEKISNLFSNLSSFNLFQLRNLLNDYKSFGYSTLEIQSHLNKLYSLPVYVTIMTILGSIIMLNAKYNKSKIFSIVSGTLISVLIYYLNYFSNVMGVNEKLPILASTWFPYIVLTLICLTGMIKVNEK